jgi:hypothetical protein
VLIAGSPGGSRIIGMVLLATLDFMAGRSPEEIAERMAGVINNARSDWGLPPLHVDVRVVPRARAGAQPPPARSSRRVSSSTMIGASREPRAGCPKM